MEPREATPCTPPWADAFPRLFAIYTVSNQVSQGNWFQQPNVWRGLLARSSALLSLEEDLQVLDPASWDVFRGKAARLVHLVDEWGYHRALFDCFNEIKGYRHLVQQGYQEVRFIPEQRDIQTPDLRARIGTSELVAMEVKTVNESIKQKDYFEIPGEQRIALLSESRLSDPLKKKLIETVSKARRQLLSVQDPSVVRRVIYIVIRPDFHVHAEEELATFLSAQSTDGIEVLHCLLN